MRNNLHLFLIWVICLYAQVQLLVFHVLDHWEQQKRHKKKMQHMWEHLLVLTNFAFGFGIPSPQDDNGIRILSAWFPKSLNFLSKTVWGHSRKCYVTFSDEVLFHLSGCINRATYPLNFTKIRWIEIWWAISADSFRRVAVYISVLNSNKCYQASSDVSIG